MTNSISSLNGKRVFVSGGAGVIGFEMIPKLIARGAKVMVGDIKPRPADFPSSVLYRQGDLNEMTVREMNQFSPEVFIHLAATFERSEESYSFWEENFWHNVRLSHHMMTLMKDQASLKRVVFASSYLIYEPSLYQFSSPQLKPVGLKESDQVQPRNLTGMAKFAHEIELRFIDQYKSNQFSSVCARIFRGYGRNSRDVISRWIRLLLNDEPITIYRPEGVFDYIYSADSAEGLIRLAENGLFAGIVNLGTGQSRSVQDVVNILRSYFPNMQAQEMKSEIAYEASEADMTNYFSKMGWRPEYNLELAIPEMIAFERARKQNINIAIKTPVVLVTSAAKKIPLIRAAKNAARRISESSRVIAGDISSDALAQYLADDFWVMPATSDDMIEAIVEGCKERDINIILPTRDGELMFWARHAPCLADYGISVIVSSPQALEICIDKQAFSNFGIARGMPFIPSALNIVDIDTKRYVVKERFGAGARAIGVDLTFDAALQHASKLTHPIFQPYVMGLEFSVDAWVDESHVVKGLVLRRREKVVDGESQVTATFVNPEFEAKSREIIETLKLRGPVVLQAIIDTEGQMHVIECNARFGGASTAGIAAGVDSFFWSFLESLGVDVDCYPFLSANGEIRQVRVPSDIYIYDSNF